MKKRIFSVILAVLLLMQTLPVFAAEEKGEVAITLDGEIRGISNVRLVEDLPYLEIETDGGYGLITVDGKVVTAAKYQRSMTAKYNYIEVAAYEEGVNTEGVLAMDGTEILPCQYGDVKILNNYWGLGIVLEVATAENYDYKGWSGDSFYLISRVDVYWLPTATCLAQLTRDQYLDADDAGRNIYIQDRAEVIRAYDSEFNLLAENVKSLYAKDYQDPDLIEFSDNGQRGIKDRDGNILLPAMFKSLYGNKGGYYYVYNGEKYGLVEMNTGNVILPAEYEKIETTIYGPYNADENTKTAYVSGGFITIVKDGKMGFADLEGNITCEPKYSSNVIQEKYGVALSYSDLEGAVHFLAADGTDTTLADYARINCLYGGSGYLYAVRDADYNKGLIDWHGNVLFEISSENYDFDLTSDGKYLLVTKYIDRQYSYYLYEVSYPYGEKEEENQPETPDESSVEESQPETPDETSKEESSKSESSSGSGIGGWIGGLIGNNSSQEESSAPEESSVEESSVEESSAPEESSVEESSAPEESSEASASFDKAAVSALINSVITLLKADAAANQTTIVTLLDTVITTCSGDTTLKNLLDTAKTLVSVDASSAVAVLEQIVTMLK